MAFSPRSGHDVTLIAADSDSQISTHCVGVGGRRLRTTPEISLPVLDELSPDDRYDLVPVPVRSEQRIGNQWVIQTVPIAGAGLSCRTS